MINQVSTNADKNAFALLQSNGAVYAVKKPFTGTQKTETEKEKRSNTLGRNIAGISLITGFGVFLLTRIFSKKSGLNIKNFSKFLEDKAAKLSENKKLTSIQNLYLVTLKNAKGLLNKSKTVFMLGTLKDIVFQKVFTLTPTLRKIRDFLTKWFEKVSVRTSNKSYSKTLLEFESMYKDFGKFGNNLPEHQKWLVENKVRKLRTYLGDGFGGHIRDQRFKNFKNNMNGLDEQIWNKTYKDFKGFIKNPKTYEEYLAEQLVAKDKLELANTVSKLKRPISCGLHDHYLEIKGLLNNIDMFIDPTDKESRVLMRNLRTHMDSYKKAWETGENAKNMFPKSDVAKDLKTLNSYISKSGKYDKTTVKSVSDSLNNLNKILRENKKGEIQEIMEIYKKHLSPEDYAKLKKTVNKSLKSLDHSIDLETDKLFDKIRDLQLGSAPHDTLALLSSLGLIGWGLSKADNNDERTSVALKYGIPALAGVITTLWCTMGLIASGPSLLIGLASTIPINKLGEYIDNTRKKYKEKPPALTLPSINLRSPAQMVQTINENGSVQY